MQNQTTPNPQRSSNTSWLVLSVVIVILGPLVAMIQLQYGDTIGIPAGLQREITELELNLAHAGAVRDVTAMHPEDILLLDATVPEGKRHDTLLAGVVQVARQHGTEVQSLSLKDSTAMTELSYPSRFRPVVQVVEFVVSGVTYEKLSGLLQDIAQARRPMIVDSWQYDAKAGTLTIQARTVVIETYATY